MKAVEKYGYKIEPIQGIEFSKAKLFSEYIDHFYDIKKYSTGSSRWIAKLHLNTLYGIFGRKKDILETIIVNNEDIVNMFLFKVIKSIIQIDNNKSVLLTINNINPDILAELNSTTESQISNKFIDVNSNVAIASAITSYARIHMMQYKHEGVVAYTDTDSIFTTQPLPNNLIGKELGMMKDELDGCIIKEAYFLDIKKYGYWYLDNNGNRIEKSTVSGIERDSLSFKEISDLS